MAGGQRPKTVVFLHPDLGIGGAERLVVDAAVGLQKRGYVVVIFTSHCDPNHCFDEARDGTLDVRVRGNTVVPPALFSRFAVLCAILRQLHLILHVYLASRELRPDAFFVDQLSAGLPLVRWLFPRAPILFYCHFPDLLLAQGRTRWWKRLYRVPFDALERWSMAFADATAVNSAFTKDVVARTWPGLARRAGLEVVYPCIDTRVDDADDDEGGDANAGGLGAWAKTGIILSINRFERKKDVALAIKAFAGLPREKRKGAKLVVAGGYDTRVSENVGYHAELAALASSLHLAHATAKNVVTALALDGDRGAAPAADVVFLLSVPHALKDALLRSARLLVYTPAREHFGIVPLEAMLRGVPVLAADSGGPTETVVDGRTGWLRPPDRVADWTDVMDRVLNRLGPAERAAMAAAARQRVRTRFGAEHMAERLDGILRRIVDAPRKPVRALALPVWAACLAATVSVVFAVLGLRDVVARTRGGGR